MKNNHTKTCPYCKGKGIISTKKFEVDDIVFVEFYKNKDNKLNGRALVIGYDECDEDNVRVRDRKGHDYIVPLACCELDTVIL
jgi:hypothetical protein